ncbi:MULTISPECIES: hypothetical protein [Mycolicibacterium]|jgi:hypothetical protein|uniref:Lipoprotein n=5 Tax=Mycolicibacterium TaxID=1866885 RepID=A0A0U1DMN0_9MYCO|nr:MULTISPECIES: hypothetical protein [Mycolicibacterium]MCV7338086.1 hypothetical protein [Mycolicibacterium senegalense]MCW1823362.1 hypothetical protein [Mycolicibacterium senegalense]MDR7290189.1 hypothetical protein [Mycolicibacterium senegalense]OBB06520.1 hypothetical protein A5718_19765 [Mycolicibacterium conceptionense]OBF00760.1 hypothetical protein A5731_20325 [Mycolicibacterium conceptionense]
MKPMKAVIFAAALAVSAGGAFSGIAAADPETPVPPIPAPGPPPGPVEPAPDAPPPAAPAAGKAIDHDGLFMVGTDIQPGNYASAGPVEGGTCYWKRMADLHGGDIIDNAFTKKPQVITIEATDKAFKTSGCQPWQPTDAVPDTPASGPIPALVGQAKLRAWMDSLNNNARNYDGSSVPMP